jgi:hypothetical protein
MENFVFATAFRPVLGSTQPPTQKVSGIKQLGRKADHSSPSSAEVKNAWSYTVTPSLRFHGVIIKQ